MRQLRLLLWRSGKLLKKIINWFLSGDCHCQVPSRLKKFRSEYPGAKPEETAIIFLGDVGFNVFQDERDYNLKQAASEFGYTLYCLRGNHELRAGQVETISWAYDKEVQGLIGTEPDFPLIHYFDDIIGQYTIDGLSIITFGGGYSVDKSYRLERGMFWNPEEQSTIAEMDLAAQHINHFVPYDMILSHIAPYHYRPTDLFLSMIDQNKVDNTMEKWFQTYLDTKIMWHCMCFGHYHRDRLESPRVMQFYQSFMTLREIIDFWQEYDETGHLPNPYYEKSPNFYME